MNHDILETERKEIIEAVNVLWTSLAKKHCFYRENHFFIREGDNKNLFMGFKQYLGLEWCPTFKLRLGGSFQIPVELSTLLGNFSSNKKPWLLVPSRNASQFFRDDIMRNENLNFAKFRARFGAARPGEWEFRRLIEVEKKFSKISDFLDEIALPYFQELTKPEYANEEWLASAQHHKPMFRVYQLYLAWVMSDDRRYKEVLGCYGSKIPKVKIADDFLSKLSPSDLGLHL